MNKTKRQQLADKKQQILADINEQRAELSEASAHWLKKTEPFDRTWHTLLSLRPLLLAGASIISIYSFKHPIKLYQWGRKALGAWGIIKTLQATLGTKTK